MAALNHDSPFQSWVLTPEEFLAGSCLTLTQKQVIQNQIATLAIQKINLEPDYAQPLATAQKEAHLRGQIDALQYLLTLSASSEAQLNPGAQNINLDSDQS